MQLGLQVVVEDLDRVGGYLEDPAAVLKDCHLQVLEGGCELHLGSGCSLSEDLLDGCLDDIECVLDLLAHVRAVVLVDRVDLVHDGLDQGLRVVGVHVVELLLDVLELCDDLCDLLVNLDGVECVEDGVEDCLISIVDVLAGCDALHDVVPVLVELLCELLDDCGFVEHVPLGLKEGREDLSVEL